MDVKIFLMFIVAENTGSVNIVNWKNSSTDRQNIQSSTGYGFFICILFPFLGGGGGCKPSFIRDCFIFARIVLAQLLADIKHREYASNVQFTPPKNE